jgi:hypothetical protein
VFNKGDGNECDLRSQGRGRVRIEGVHRKSSEIFFKTTVMDGTENEDFLLNNFIFKDYL